MKRKIAPAHTPVTKQAESPDISELLKLVAGLQATVNEQQQQIEGLQQGQLKIVETFTEALSGLSGEIMRLERHSGLNVSNILLPNMTSWRNIQERK